MQHIDIDNDEKRIKRLKDIKVALYGSSFYSTPLSLHVPEVHKQNVNKHSAEIKTLIDEIQDFSSIDKYLILRLIRTLSLEQQIPLLKQCLDRNSVLGNRMWKAEFPYTGCGYWSGALKQIYDLLKKLEPDYIILMTNNEDCNRRLKEIIKGRNEVESLSRSLSAQLPNNTFYNDYINKHRTEIKILLDQTQDFSSFEKSDLLAVIKKLQKDELIQLLERCLDKNSALGMRMWKAEFPYTGCGYGSGTITEICWLLKQLKPDFVAPAINDEDRNRRLKEIVIELDGENFYSRPITRYYPELYQKKIEQHVFEIKTLLDETQDFSVIEKRILLAAIKKLPKDQRIPLLKKCLYRGNALGDRMWKTEFPYTGCGYSSGTLKEIFDLIKKVEPDYVISSLALNTMFKQDNVLKGDNQIGNAPTQTFDI